MRSLRKSNLIAWPGSVDMPPQSRLLTRWHNLLGLPRHPASWYWDRLKEELGERRAAKTPIEKLSETSDVFYALSRSRHDGFPTRSLPPFVASRHIPVYAYFLGKYTLRWKFYRLAARICGSPTWRSVREVVNPERDHKTAEVAARHGIDVAKFQGACRDLRRYWPLLP